MHQTSPLEQAFINALAARYANPQPEDRSGLDQAYAEAMCNVWHQHPESADAATLFAEAAMDLHPWDLWNNDQPQPWTPEILAALESAMKLDANHPGANHLYIHGMEASTHPEKASTSARPTETFSAGLQSSRGGRGLSERSCTVPGERLVIAGPA